MVRLKSNRNQTIDIVENRDRAIDTLEACQCLVDIVQGHVLINNFVVVVHHIIRLKDSVKKKYIKCLDSKIIDFSTR